MSPKPPLPAEGGDRRRPLTRIGDSKLRCSSCRRFDGIAWCHGWNVPTGPDDHICQMYRARREPKPSPPGC